MNRNQHVSVIHDPQLRYPGRAQAASMIDPAAPLYAAVAEAVASIGLPELDGLVRPGDRVVIKPNWVSDRHPAGDEHLFGNITHGAVLAALADMAMRRAGPDGQVVIAEVTTQEAGFRREAELSGMWAAAGLLAQRYGQPLRLLDLRSQIARFGPDGLVAGLREAPGVAPDGCAFGDEAGYALVDLGQLSEHAAREGVANRLRVTDYSFSPEMKSAQAAETAIHHTTGKHTYCIPRTILASDVFICVPKFKTHVKAGVTFALKNLIGINARKGLIPHRKQGSTSDGGDEWPTATEIAGLDPRLIANLDRVRDAADANWFGNDTLWRTIVDLNKILRYGRTDGTLGAAPQRRYLAVVDGIQGSEGSGPTNGTRRSDGLLIAGTDPVHVDTVATTVMGFDWRAFPHIARAYGVSPAVRITDQGPDSIEVTGRPDALLAWQRLRRDQSLAYEAAPGWITRVELA